MCVLLVPTPAPDMESVQHRLCFAWSLSVAQSSNNTPGPTPAAAMPLQPADPPVVTSDRQLFAAICAQSPLIWLGADLDLREEHWPANCSAPVRLDRNMTISGPLDSPIKYTINFNFMARKVGAVWDCGCGTGIAGIGTGTGMGTGLWYSLRSFICRRYW